MELEKRKREDEGDVHGKRGKGSEENEGVLKPPADEEVEQFFAIMKRIQVAVKYFQKKQDTKRDVAVAVTPWNPSFEREDFDPMRSSTATTNEGLDLNSQPDDDSVETDCRKE